MMRKGYNLVVHSWENDGDFKNARTKTYENINEVKAIFESLEIFKPYHDVPHGFGNGYGDDITDEKLLAAMEFVNQVHNKHNMSLVFSEDKIQEFEKWVNKLHRDLMGTSEEYDYRVFDYAELYYLPEDPLKIEL